jgi:hypothetical protein
MMKGTIVPRSEPDRIERRSIDGAQGWICARGEDDRIQRHIFGEHLRDVSLGLGPTLRQGVHDHQQALFGHESAHEIRGQFLLAEHAAEFLSEALCQIGGFLRNTYGKHPVRFQAPVWV